MTASHEFVYNLLKDAVGEEWVSDDRAMCEAYSKDTAVSVVLRKHRKDPTMLPEFVLLPSTTEEVAAVNRIADRYGIKVIPIGTGVNQSGLCIPTKHGFRRISMDLKRMDKVLEIDDENMTIRIQPWVSIATAQAETMKRGLWNGGTPLAPATVGLLSNIMFGAGSIWQSALYSGLGIRAMVNVTVVLANGDIINVGSRALPQASDTFWCQGPGPDLRGLFEWGHDGSFGVITEATVKLYPWPAKEWPEEVIYDRPPLPKNNRIYWFTFPGFEEWKNAINEICHADIGTHLNGASDVWIANDTQPTNELAEKLYREGYFPEQLAYCVTAAITSEEQLDYEEKVLKEIVAEYGGTFMTGEFLDTVSTINMDAYRSGNWSRATRPGAYSGLWMAYAQIKNREQYFKDKMELIKDKPHHIFDEEIPYVYPTDRGYYALYENDVYLDQSSEKMVREERELTKGGFIELTMEKRIGYYFLPEPLVSIFGPVIGPNVHLWLKQIKEVLDPKDTMNPAKVCAAFEEPGK